MPYKTAKRRNRKKILAALSGGSKFFSELEESLNLSPPTISAHLRELEEEGTVASRMGPDDRRKRMYWRPGLGKGRSREIITMLDGQLNGSLTADQTEKIRELLTGGVLDALGEISEHTEKGRIRGHGIPKAGTTALDAVWVWAAKDELRGGEIESAATDRKTLMRAFPVLKSIRNLPRGGKMLKRAVKKVKDRVGLGGLVTGEKNKILKIAEKRGAVEKLNELSGLLRGIVLKDGKDSVAYFNMMKTREIYAYRLGVGVQAEIMERYGKEEAKELGL